MQKKQNIKSEQYKKVIRRRQIVIISVFVLVVLLCVCLFTPIFGISEITVTGNSVLSQEEVIKTSGIETGENVFRISERKAKKALLKLAYVNGIDIKRKFPAKIVIEVDEAKPDLIIDTLKEFIVSTAYGRVLEVTQDVTHLTSPIVYGFEIEKAEPAKTLVPKEEEHYNTNIERIACFYETDFWDQIDEFYVKDASNFMMIMKSGMKVTFGSIESIESLQRKIKMLAQILPQIKQTEHSYLDLTTDKGYFGEYTKEELLEMEEKENGETSQEEKEENKKTKGTKEQETETAEKENQKSADA